MLSKEQAMTMMQESVDGLQRGGIISETFPLTPDMVIFGSDSPLDSIGFVTFITDVEERLNAATGKDLCITLLDIDNFDENDPSLSVDLLADYLVRLGAS